MAMQPSCGGRKEKPHVAMFPSAGMGHYMPFLHLARVLTIHHGFSVTFINTQNNVSHSESAHVKALASSGLDIQIVEMEVESPSVAADGKTNDPFVAHWEAVRRSMAAFERILKTLISPAPPAPPICAVITDQVLTPTLHISSRLNLPNYVFFTSSAFMLAFVLHAPILVARGCDFSDQSLVLDIPGLPPVPATDIPPALKNRDNLFFRIFLSSGVDLCKASGIFINTFQELERDFIEGIRGGRIAENFPPIYPVGPVFLPSVESENGDTLSMAAAEGNDAGRCLQWLDAQPAKSVVYVSFGSRSAMSAEQLRELALGLEASGHRFLWVVRLSVVATSATQDDVSPILPPGFGSRVKDRGLVVSSWVPQAGILSHVAVAAFVSHCGWNSVVESISYGIPFVAWPLSGDQMMNSRLLVDCAKVGVRILKGNEGIVSRDEVQRGVRSVMIGEEGRALRRRAMELGDYARAAIKEEGSSRKCLKEAVDVWKRSSNHI